MVTKIETMLLTFLLGNLFLPFCYLVSKARYLHGMEHQNWNAKAAPSFRISSWIFIHDLAYVWQWQWTSTGKNLCNDHEEIWSHKFFEGQVVSYHKKIVSVILIIHKWFRSSEVFGLFLAAPFFFFLTLVFSLLPNLLCMITAGQLTLLHCDPHIPIWMLLW